MKIYLLTRNESDPYDNRDWIANVGYTTDPITAAAWAARPYHYTKILQEIKVKNDPKLEFEEQKDG